MLEKFKKAFGSQPEAKQESAEAVANDTRLALLQTEFDQFKLEAEQLLEAASLQNEKLTADLAAAQEALKGLEEAKAAMEKNALEAKLAARKEKIVAAIGTEKADPLMAATEGMDDASFEAVVSALAGSVAAEANTELFKEAGVDAKAKTPVTDPAERLKQAIDAELNQK